MDGLLYFFQRSVKVKDFTLQKTIFNAKIKLEIVVIG